MNIYGDRGNIITLVKRCQWRGITLHVRPIMPGAEVDWGEFDLAFFGGGQDSGQTLIASDLLHRQGTGLTRAIENGLVMLAICGGYQLLGHYFLTHTGERLPGVGVLDIHTVGGKKRMIGNIVITVTHGARNEPGQEPPATSTNKPCQTNAKPTEDSRLQPGTCLVGFENHSGRTYHGKNVSPLGQVVVGYGDNGEDKRAGAVYRNTIGCYLHGSLLPKNPHLADHLIVLALQRRFGTSVTLPMLDNALEVQAHRTMVERLCQ
jgi:hypothetical protein